MNFLRARGKPLLLLLTLLLAAGFVLVRSPSGYAVQNRDLIGAGASRQHPAGTDDLGRDRAVRVSAALLLGLSGALAAAAAAAGIGTAVGVAAAFAPPVLSWLLLYLCDLLLTLPWLFLLMTVRASLPLTLAPAISAGLTFVLLALLGWPAYARVTHTNAAALRHSDWLIHARAQGLSAHRITRVHMLPHLRPLLRSQILLNVPAFLIAEANLGTVGLGISEPLPSWGSMLLELERTSAFGASAWIYLPVALLVVVLLLLEVTAAQTDAAQEA